MNRGNWSNKNREHRNKELNVKFRANKQSREFRSYQPSNREDSAEGKPAQNKDLIKIVYINA